MDDVLYISAKKYITKYKHYESDDEKINNTMVPNSEIKLVENIVVNNLNIFIVKKKPNTIDQLKLEGNSIPIEQLLTFLYENSDINYIFKAFIQVNDYRQNTNPENIVNIEEIYYDQLKSNKLYQTYKKKQAREIAINNSKINGIQRINVDKINNIGYCNTLKNSLNKQYEKEQYEEIKSVLSNKMVELDDRINTLIQEKEAKIKERERIAEERRMERERIAEEKRMERERIAEERQAKREKLNQRCEGSWNEIFICECSKECVQRNRPCDDDIHRLTNLWRAGVNALLPYHIQQLRSICPRTCRRANL